MIKVTSRLWLDERDIRFHFVHASGPGGQNVNKVATAVQLRFNLSGAGYMPEDVRERLIRLAGRRMTGEGILVIHAARFRSQERNRQDALERLIALTRRAAERPKPRKKTRPSAASRERRLKVKRHRSETKRSRHGVAPHTE